MVTSDMEEEDPFRLDGESSAMDPDVEDLRGGVEDVGSAMEEVEVLDPDSED